MRPRRRRNRVCASADHIAREVLLTCRRSLPPTITKAICVQMGLPAQRRSDSKSGVSYPGLQDCKDGPLLTRRGDRFANAVNDRLPPFTTDAAQFTNDVIGLF